VTFGADDREFSFQSDAVPQQLILRTFNEEGKPALGGKPHPLFFYRQDRVIQVFPDHRHEGAVVIPKDFDQSVWRKNEKEDFQPRPRVVAYGLDKRNGRRLKLVAAYDGDRVGAGRIVADSTWHHYFNINLENFQHPATEDSAADQIGQFYGNLALWLSSLEKRYEMADAMVRWLAQRPDVSEEVGPVPSKRISDIMSTGDTARRLLSQVASPCEIHELLQLIIDEPYREQSETLYLPEKGFHLSFLPSKELLLGYVIHHFQRESNEAVGLSLSDDMRRRARRVAIAAGSEQAFGRQAREVERTAMSALKFVAKANTKTSELSERNEP
jgi:hypothetical protein